jgi:hypothetical protein
MINIEGFHRKFPLCDVPRSQKDELEATNEDDSFSRTTVD